MRHITDDERRARLARRHGIAPAYRLPDPVLATRAMTVLHATEPPSVYLSLLARVDDITVDDVDRALYRDRTLVKQLAMRRTVFIFTRDLLPAAWGSASARVAVQNRARLVKEVEAAGIAGDGELWLKEAAVAVVARLTDGPPLSAAQLREQVPELAGTFHVSPDKKYGGTFQIAPRVLVQLAVERLIMRAENGGHWRISRPTWTVPARWLGDIPDPLPEQAGYAELVRRWLSTFGPGTTADIQWWLGSTVTTVRRALADVDAVQVSLDGGDVGWVLPDDVEPVEPAEPWAALLPVLDPTVMGWKQRGFYLGPHAPLLFDTNGNAGTTAWWNGRIVGCWVQDSAGVVEVRLVEDVPQAAREALQIEADRLTGWLGGIRVSTVYPSAAMNNAAPAVRADRSRPDVTSR